MELKFIKLDSNKQPLYKRTDPRLYLKEDELEREDNVGIIVPDDVVVIDFDKEGEFDIAYNIVESIGIKTMVMRSGRGGHMWFKIPEGFEPKVSSHLMTPLQLMIDTRTGYGGKQSHVVIKKDGEWREFDGTEELDYLPHIFTPVEKYPPEDKMDRFKFWFDQRNRNTSMYQSIIWLTRYFGRLDTIEILDIVNRFILDTPISGDEFATITREEAFNDIIHKNFYEGQKFLHQKVAEYLMVELSLFKMDENNLMYYDASEGMYKRLNRQASGNLLHSKIVELCPASTKRNRIEVMETLMARVEQFKPSGEEWVACKNGVLNVYTRQLIPFTPMIKVTRKIDTMFDPTANDTRVDDFLMGVSCGDTDVISLLCEMIGYTLMRTNKYESWFVLEGGGSNGKSTYIETIEWMLGTHNVSKLELVELEGTGDNRFKRVDLVGKFANLGDDIGTNTLEQSSILKKIATGEGFTVEQKGDPVFNIHPTDIPKLIFSWNEPPKFKDKSYGFARRFVVIPFNARFDQSSRNADLKEIWIKEECFKSTLLNYALDAISITEKRYKESQGKHHLTVPQLVTDRKEEFLLDNDTRAMWLDKIHHNIEDGTPFSDIYTSYKDWCEVAGILSFGEPKFIEKLEDYGFTVREEINKLNITKVVCKIGDGKKD